MRRAIVTRHPRAARPGSWRGPRPSRSGPHGYGNIEHNPKVGLIFLIPGHNSTVRINGRVTVVDRSELSDAKLEVFDPDEKAEVLQGLLLDVEESYSHCPRALKFSRLWDVGEISKNVAKPPIGVKEPGI